MQKELRFLALDLDDTILRSDLSLSNRTRKTLKRLDAEGKITILASGRIPESMERYVRLLGMDSRLGYLISNNGSLIRESHTNKVLFEALLDRQTILTICDLADSENFPLQMYADRITYISKQNEYSSRDAEYTGLRQVLVENFRAMAGNGSYEITIPGDSKQLSSIESLIKNELREKVETYISRRNFLQITPANVNKGTSLAALASIVGFTASEVIALGDSMNDEDMIRWSGVGVAMASGSEGLKKAANFVTKFGNDEDGAAEFLESYFFQ